MVALILGALTLAVAAVTFAVVCAARLSSQLSREEESQVSETNRSSS